MITLIRFKRSIITAALVFLLAGATSVSADTLRLNVGLWPGERETELEPRFFLDDLIPEGRLNLPWANTNTNTIFPLGFQYFKPLGSGSLVVGLNYTRYAPEYGFNGIGLPGSALYNNSVSIVNLEDYSANDWDFDIGYQFQPVKGRLFLTPRIGVRWAFQDFNYNELTLGQTITVSLDSPYSANATGAYIGIGGQFYMINKLSLVFDYMTTSVMPSLTGDMSFERTVIGTGPTLSYNNAESGYEIDINRWRLGLRYDITSAIGLEFGLQEEVTRVSYPGYFDLPIVVGQGGSAVGLTVTEIVTDILFWDQTQETKKGLVYFAFSYDLNL